MRRVLIPALFLVALALPAGVNSLATTCGTSGVEEHVPCSELTLGPIHSPISEFVNMTDPKGDGFVGVNLAGRVVVQNTNHSGQSEKHTTMGSSRDLPKGSTSCRAFAWLWLSKAEFTPSGWSLIWQLQMSGSPIAAISNDQQTLRWFLNSRDGTTARKYDLGPLVYGQWEDFVVCIHLADKPGGWVEVWMAHGAMPDVSQKPLVYRGGIDTWQEATGHDTLGMYAAHGKADTYRGYFAAFGRALTAQRAVDLAQ